MKGLKFIAIAMFVPSVALAWPWSTDMMNQPSIKPQEGVAGIHPFPARSVPVAGIPTALKSRDETMNLKNPIPVTAASLKEGEILFKIYCSACHGLTGKAESPVSAKIGALDLTMDYIQKDLTEGWIWGTITFGGALMPAYGVVGEGGGSNDLSPEERWHVVNYLRNGLVKK